MSAIEALFYFISFVLFFVGIKIVFYFYSAVFIHQIAIVLLPLSKREALLRVF
jgi:hypothetical protein